MSTLSQKLQKARSRVRRFQLVTGLGLAACIAGAVVAAPLAMRLAPKLQGVSPVLAIVVLGLLGRIWVVLWLPLISYGVGRVIDVKPTSTAVGAALTGELFVMLIQLVTSGWGALAHPLDWAVRLGTLGGGVAMTRWALVRARAASARKQAAAEEKAKAAKAEYEHFASKE